MARQKYEGVIDTQAELPIEKHPIKLNLFAERERITSEAIAQAERLLKEALKALGSMDLRIDAYKEAFKWGSGKWEGAAHAVYQGQLLTLFAEVTWWAEKMKDIRDTVPQSKVNDCMLLPSAKTIGRFRQYTWDIMELEFLHPVYDALTQLHEAMKRYEAALEDNDRKRKEL